MADEIYISITGNQNELWEKCLDQKLVALSFDKSYFAAWQAGDYDTFWTLERDAHPDAPDRDTKAKATLWYNRGTLLTESVGDIWLHRDGSDLFWAETTDGGSVFEEYDDTVMIAKPVAGWSKRNRRTVPLTWNSIHPKAKSYLVTQQAVFRVACEDMKSYLRALVDGEDLSHWHERAEWKERLGENKSLGKNVELSELAITRMMMSIEDTVKNSNGQRILKTLKNKNLLCTKAEMQAHLAHLMEAQKGLCAITNLPMHFDGQEDREPDMLVSADRIDSSGHYEIGNMQLVCRFVNFWKCAQDNGRFLELLERVVNQRLAVED